MLSLLRLVLVFGGVVIVFAVGRVAVGVFLPGCQLLFRRVCVCVCVCV